MGLAAGHCGQAHVKIWGTTIYILWLHQKPGEDWLGAHNKPG
jgi:hypothetical protein